MKKLLFITIPLIIPLLISACGLFETRMPEEPESGDISFIPPSTASIVISNFINAFNSKNTENYTACFADTTLGDHRSFQFLPSSEAEARYSGFFTNWTVEDERKYFFSMTTKIEIDINPEITLSNSRFDVMAPDSAVFVSSYYLKINHNLKNAPIEFQGYMQLAILPKSNGLWAIQRWEDISSDKDSIKSSFSTLKAIFLN